MRRYRLRDLSHDLRLEKSFNLVLFSSQMVAVVPRNDRLKVSKYVYCVHSTQYVAITSHGPPWGVTAPEQQLPDPLRQRSRYHRCVYYVLI